MWRLTPYDRKHWQNRRTRMSSPLLSLTDAQLALEGNAGPVEILHGITLDVHSGETVGLVGPSGSGKSSLLMLMGGLERATGGTVRAFGHDLGTINEDALARLRRAHVGEIGRASCRERVCQYV